MTNPEAQPPRILLIGPIGSGASATNVVGGNRLLTTELLRELHQRGFELEVLDTSGRVTRLPAWQIQAFRMVRFLRVLWGIAKKIRSAQLVYLVISARSAIVLASSVWLFCKIARRPLVLRLSGADIGLVYRSYNALARRLAQRAWMRASLVYVETKGVYRDFDHLDNFRWFPNTRDITAPATSPRKLPCNLVFLSRLHMSKGLGEALEACRALPEGCHLRVYGPPMSDTDLSLFEGHPGASYGGVLPLEDVPHLLAEHDLLLSPSYYEMEGYPGVVIEAFQCGLPVIAATWRNVPELVIHEENGLLVEPRSAKSLRAAIERLLTDPALFQSLRQGALRQGERFRSANWYDRMADDLRECCRP